MQSSASRWAGTFLTFPLSTARVSITMTAQRCLYTICQKSPRVDSFGPCSMCTILSCCFKNLSTL